jgi:hypothetical protein
MHQKVALPLLAFFHGCLQGEDGSRLREDGSCFMDDLANCPCFLPLVENDVLVLSVKVLFTLTRDNCCGRTADDVGLKRDIMGA